MVSHGMHRVSSHWFAAWRPAYFYVSEPKLFTSGLYYALLVAALTGWLFKPKLRGWRITAAGFAVCCGSAYFGGKLR